MKAMEICLIVLACCVPFVVLLMAHPIKFKHKKGQKPVKLENPAKEVETPVVEQAKEDTEPFYFSEPEDFKTYAKEKQTKLSKPEFKTNRTDVDDFLPDLSMLEGNKKPANKPLVQQIGSLSPELKAILLSGAISDPKFDD